MKKGIELRPKGNVGPNAGTAEEVRDKLQRAFAAAPHGLSVEAGGLDVDAGGNLSGTVYVSGEQAGPLDFAALATGAFRDALRAVSPSPSAPSAAAASAGPPSDEPDIEVAENEDEDEDVIAPPPQLGAPAPAPPPAEPRQRTRRRLFDDEAAEAAATVTKPDALADCPLGGDGGDRLLNELKNRTQAGDWKDVDVQAVLDLAWPEGIEQRRRETWPDEAMQEVLANEKDGAMRLTGWLAGAKKEGEESCNCHSPTNVDHHLWLVDDPAKANLQDRGQSVVCETTPRVSATKKGGWDLQRIRSVVVARTQVRLSGWLLMDQEHPDQLGKTRGTLWEMHPIIAFEIKQGEEWVPLEQAQL